MFEGAQRFESAPKRSFLEDIDDQKAGEVLEQSIVQGGRYKGYFLTTEILEDVGLEPKHKLTIDNTDIYSSPIYTLENRMAVVAYVKKDGKTFVRSYYRSNSQGVWRYLPDYGLMPDHSGNMGMLGKGYEEQSVNLPIALQEALSKIAADSPAYEIRNQDPSFILAGTAVEGGRPNAFYLEIDAQPQRLDSDFYNKPVIQTISADRIEEVVDEVRRGSIPIDRLTRSGGLRNQVRYLIEADRIDDLPESRPGHWGISEARNFDELYDGINFVGGVKQLDSGFKAKPEQIRLSKAQSPDFSNLITSWEQETGLYGKIRIEAFSSNDGKFKFMFCSDSANRVWIGGIEAEGEVQSSGLNKAWVDGGDLTTPAYEYKLSHADQTGGYGNDAMKKESYVDMYKNYLSKIPVIKQYVDMRMTETSGVGSELPKVESSKPIGVQIGEANSFYGLYEALRKAGSLPGSDNDYSAEVLIDRIEGVRRGEHPINFITRSAGLRDRVADLLESDESR
ncbi:MAG: hypothetical protein Q8O87_00550 [bacterium]|nr:hypothetical protein [bacterium]